MGKTFANYKSDKRSISRIYKELLDVHILLLSHIQLFLTLWTIAHKAPLSVGCPGEECWSGLPCPPPEGFPAAGIEPRSPALQADSLSAEPPWEAREKRQCSNIMNTLSGDQEYFLSCLHTLWNRASYN